MSPANDDRSVFATHDAVVVLDAVRTGNRGPVVVLLHPVGLDGTAWAPLAACLAKCHTVMAPSLRGHGTSPAPVPPWTIRDVAADVHALLHQARVAPAHVVGLSLGGIVAQQLALDHPDDVRSLVLIATRAGFDDPARDVLSERGRRGLENGMTAVVEDTIARWFAPTARQGPIAARVRQRLLDDDPQTWAATWQAMAGFDAHGQLAAVHHPALVLAGSADAGTPPRVSRALAAMLPHATLEIVKGAGHLAPLEHPEHYATLIERFLQRSTRSAQDS